MATFEPFRAVFYHASIDPALVTSPPYDVIPEAERRRLEQQHPNNIIRIILGAEQPGDDAGHNKYTRSAACFRDWLGAGVLVADDQPRLYAYRMHYAIDGAERDTGGVIAAVGLEPFSVSPSATGGIYAHERTLPKPRGDRLDLTRAARANLEPIWLVGGGGVVGVALASASQRPALVDFSDPAGVRHQLWPLTADEASPFSGGLNAPLVIADGHHRYTASLNFRDEMRASVGPGPWDATLALISDPSVDPPALLAIHRLTDLTLDDLRPHGPLTPFPGDIAALGAHLAGTGPGTLGIAHRSGRWTLPAAPGAGQPDTAWLAADIIEPAGAVVTYEHDVEVVAAAVAGGSLAVLMAPIPIAFVIQTALAGGVMPPKSTLFWPKPRTGIVLRDFERP
jgi:uncharacterized protein (DUF1015 family)